MTDLSKIPTDQLLSMLAQHQEPLPVETPQPQAPEKSSMENVKESGRDIGAGAIKGAANIGASLLAPYDFISDKLSGTSGTNAERRTKTTEALQQLVGADPNSYSFKAGELGSEIAGTSGVGRILSLGAKAVPFLARTALPAALESGGFKLGTAVPTTIAGKIADAATRVAGGAAVGGASAGLVNPQDAGAGAVLGGLLPPAAKAAGMAGKALGTEVAPEVAALYQKAKNLGIDIPADRITNSKPLNALAASLNYVPFSGRAATEERMVSQLNQALSRTFGQDSPNVTQALRKAGDDLGNKFNQVLSSNGVKVDQQLIDELASHRQIADSELGSEGAKIINNQVDQILAKGQNGAIDGQAAYNIKKTLDRIGNRNTPEAFYARELKKSLMGALNRSLGPDEAAKFAQVRRQYGNMLDLENLAQNGAEGGISVGRLANLKNINNPELQDIADIAAQFVKSRENPHGAAQRVVLGALGAGVGGATGTLPLVAGAMAGARVANTALNSGLFSQLLLNQPAVRGLLTNAISNPAARGLIYGTATQ